MHTWYLPFLWIANGVLALVWLLVEHIWVILLVPALTLMVTKAEEPQRPWALAASGLALLASLLAPFPTALLLLLMVGTGLGAVRLERISPQNTHWTVIRGLALYSLVGLGYAAYRAWLVPAMSDPALLQGQVYLSAIASIALYVFPLGYLVLLAQSLFAHPPIQGQADELIYRYRSRGKP